jgi:hypothetical protein
MQIPPKEPFKRLTTSAMTHFSLTQSCIVAAFVCYLSSCRAAACTLLFMFAANYLPALLENWRHDREEADLLSRVAKRELLVGKWKANAENTSSSSLTMMRPPRYAPDDPELAAYLNVHGFVVVQAAADSSQVQKATGLLWEGAFMQRQHDVCTFENCGREHHARGRQGRAGLCEPGVPKVQGGGSARAGAAAAAPGGAGV